MKVSVFNVAGKAVGTVDLPPAIFEARVNRDLMHQALVRQLANARLGTHKTKSRSEVNRTTAKWYRQKGTGRARHGSKRAPIFVGGGVAHGPRPRSYSKDMPKKMRRAALRSALSVKAGAEAIVILDQLRIDGPKTRYMVEILERLVGQQSALLVMAEQDANIELAARNLRDTKTLRATYLNVRDLLGYHKIVMPLAALEVIQGYLSPGEAEIVAADLFDETDDADEEE